MSTAERLITADEFYDLPEPPEGGKMELIDGRSVTMSPVGMQHGDIALAIGAAFRAFVLPRRIGTAFVETGFRVRRDPDTVLAPDVSFVQAARLPAEPSRRTRYLDGFPDLAVEVLSPDDWADEVSAKVPGYLASGTPRVWVVQPRSRTVTVHRPGGDSHTYSGADVLSSDDAGFTEPGFTLPLAEIFA